MAESLAITLINGGRSFDTLVDLAPLAPVRSRLLLAHWLEQGFIEPIPASELPQLAEACITSNPERAAHLAVAMFGTPQAAQGEALRVANAD